MVSSGVLATLEDMADDASLHNLQADGLLIPFNGSNGSYQKIHDTKLTPEPFSDYQATDTSSVLQRFRSADVDALPSGDFSQRKQPSGCRKRKRQQAPRSAVDGREERVKRHAVRRAPTDIPQPLKLPKMAEKPAPQLFSCPFYTHDPESFRLSIHAGRNIHRLKEHLYRTHCPEQVCDQCSEGFKSASELSQHRLPNSGCRTKTGSTYGYIDSRKKAMIKKERMQGKPCAEKWDWIYRLIFECAPPSAACESKDTNKPVDTEPNCDNNSGVWPAEGLAYLNSPTTALPVEERSLLDDFEAYVSTEMQFSCDPDSLSESQACLNMIAKYRDRRCQSHSRGMSESARSSGNSFRLGGCPPQYEGFGEDIHGGLGAWQPELYSTSGSLWFPGEVGQREMFVGSNRPYHLPQVLPQALLQAEFEADVLGLEAQKVQPWLGWQNGFGMEGDGSFFFS